MRGALIMAFKAEFHRVDPTSIRAVDPVGSAGAGFDDVFREPRGEDVAGAPTPIRRELAPVMIPVQVEDDTFEAVEMHEAGDEARGSMKLIVHARDLERAGLVDDDGRPALSPGDRLGAIYTSHGVLVQRVRNPPGLYVESVTPSGWGLSLRHAQRNLFVVILGSWSLAGGARA